MECNKEEAIRAKEIAEGKMEAGDFAGAKRIAQKALQLDPHIQNISQLLIVCEVHISAQNKINGSDMDWYGILQADRCCDEAVIKKQYRKLALSLHPDKNKFAGAEAAFKLIGEANRVLADPSRRSLYDMKFRGLLRPVAPKPAPHQSNRNSHAKKQHVAANKYSGGHYSHSTNLHPNHQPLRPTFWTCCRNCSMRFEYYKEFLSKMLRCPNCQLSFIAHDVGAQGMSPGTPWSQFYYQKGIHSQGSSKVVPQSDGGKPSRNVFEGSDTMPKAGKVANVGSKHEESKAGNAAEAGAHFQQQEKANGHEDVGVEAGKGDVSIPDVTQSKESKTSNVANRKRGRKSLEECSENTGIHNSNGEKVVIQGDSGLGGRPRKSSRKKQNASYNENLNDDDSYVGSPPKRSRGNKSSSVAEEMEEAGVDRKVLKEDPSAGSFGADTAAMDGEKSEIKQRTNSAAKESPWSKRNKTGVCNAKGEEASMSEKADTNLGKNVGKSEIDDESKLITDATLQSEIFRCPDPDFNDFDSSKAESCFVVNQVWAIYDPADGMPRYYARVNKVFSPGFKIKITWLEAISDDKDEQEWCNEDLPVSCGKFENGSTEETTNQLIFSHQMYCMRGNVRGIFFIYPKKGETWALFKNWDKKWSAEPEEHRPPYQFEFVEILSDFDENYGIGVTYLCKVKGFVSIFQQAANDRVISFCIKPGELYRFSHRIPSFKMTGKEGEGVPAGSFEFDPASLPTNLDDLGDPIDIEEEKENSEKEAVGACSKSAENKLKQTNSLDNICTPKKHESWPRKDEVRSWSFGHDHPCPPGKFDSSGIVRESLEGDASASCSVSFEDKPKSTKGSKKICVPQELGAVPERGTSVLRKSHRGLNGIRKRGNQVDASQFVNEQEGSKTVSNGNRVQLKGSDPAVQVERTRTPKRQMSESAVDALEPRRSPRDLSKRSSQTNASQFITVEGAEKHTAANNDVNHGQSSGFRSHFEDKMYSHVKGGGPTGLARSSMPSDRRVVEVNPYDFKREKAEDKFKLGQIWALYSDKDGLPRNYGKVKKIDSAPDFRVHVAMLEACSPRKDSMRPVCCGMYRVKNFETRELSPSTFSHRLNARPIGKDRYEICPRKGEIWAVYKNWNSESNPGISECDFAEVLEDNEQSVKVLFLMRVNGCESFYRAPRTQRSKSWVMDIPHNELSRFSHPCSAYQQMGGEDLCLRGYWELDPHSIPGTVIVVD